MASLFEGTPQTATSYVSTTSELPKWQQDALYNQIQLATNTANRPYNPYTGYRVAGLDPMQEQAYAQVQKNLGAYQPGMDFASSGMQGMAGKGTAAQLQAAQAPYLQPDLVSKNLNQGQQLFGQAAGMDIVGAAQPYLNRAGSMDIVGAAQPYLNRAGSMDIMGAAQPYLQGAASQNIVGAAQPYINQAGAATAQSLAERALTAANPYLTAAGQTSASQVGQYMSPYQQGVLDVIAKQGARNLSENLLPQVSDSFIKAGQFGSNRMGEFGSRALRDTQEAILNQQSQAAQQGYGQSLSAAQADLARQGQLAGTVGSISGADLSRVLQGGAQYGNLGQTLGQLTGQQASTLANIGQTSGQLTSQQMQNLANIGQTSGQITGQQMQALTNLGQTSGQLTGQQMQNLANLGQMQTAAGQSQQQYGLSAAQQNQAAQAQDYTRQMSALQSVGDIARQNQALKTADAAALESAGAAQRGVNQQMLDAARIKYEEEIAYPQKQLDWLSTQVRGIAPYVSAAQTQAGTTTGASYSPSPLSQLATGIYTAKGLASI